MGLPEDELQSLTAQPWDDRLCPLESGRDEQGVMSTLLIAHHDLRLGDLNLGGGIHEVLKQMPRREKARRLISTVREGKEPQLHARKRLIQAA